MTRQKNYLTIKEAANFAGKSERTIRRAIKKGDLKASKASGKYQVLITNLVALYELDLDKVSTLSSQMSSQMSSQASSQVSSQVSSQNQTEALSELIAILRAELAQKDEQIAKLMQALQAQQVLTMELTKRLPALPKEPEDTKSVPAETEPPTKGKGLWARVRGRFKSS